MFVSNEHEAMDAAVSTLAMNDPQAHYRVDAIQTMHGDSPHTFWAVGVHISAEGHAPQPHTVFVTPLGLVVDVPATPPLHRPTILRPGRLEHPNEVTEWLWSPFSGVPRKLVHALRFSRIAMKGGQVLHWAFVHQDDASRFLDVRPDGTLLAQGLSW